MWVPEMTTAVDHPRLADDSGRVPIFVATETECADDEDDADEALRFRAAYSAACCFSPACPSSHRLRRHSMLRVPQTATTLSRKAWHSSVLTSAESSYLPTRAFAQAMQKAKMVRLAVLTTLARLRL